MYKIEWDKKIQKHSTNRQIHFFAPEFAIRVIEKFANIDIDAEKFADLIKTSRRVTNVVNNHLKSYSIKTDEISMQQCLILIGMLKARDFICAVEQFRHLNQSDPQTSSAGKYDLKMNELLCFAKKAEDYALKHHIPYPDMAFLCGYIYDVYMLMLRKQLRLTNSYLKFTEAVFEKGLRTGHLLFEMNQKLKRLHFSKYIFAAGVLHEIGKIIMQAFLENEKPDMQTLSAWMHSKKLSLPSQFAVEYSSYDTVHEIYSAWALHDIKLLTPIIPVLQFYRAPQLMHKSSQELKEFAYALGIAARIVEQHQLPTAVSDEWIASVFPQSEFRAAWNAKIVFEVSKKVSGL